MVQVSTKGYVRPPLVYADTYGLLGSNYYWRKAKEKRLTLEKLVAAGMTSGRVEVHPELIRPLLNVDKLLQEVGYRLYLVDGYRSPELYRLIEPGIIREHGAVGTARILNIEDMPHATGKSVDVTLWSIESGEFVQTRRAEDKIDAYFVDFYKNADDAESQEYHALQRLVIRLMMNHGFRLGAKREYFHFNFAPDTPDNYR